MTRKTTVLATIGLLGLFWGGPALEASEPPTPAEKAPSKETPELSPETVLSLLLRDDKTFRSSLEEIESGWHPSHPAMLAEVLVFTNDPSRRRRIVSLVEKKTGRKLGSDVDRWYEWIWQQPYPEAPAYAEFKSRLYRNIDPLFAEYFSRERAATIRLDEVRWGGVQQDGIPPLRVPDMIPATKAGYLKDDHVVFGIEVEGDARAYPKRVLAWHEMFTDEIRGVPVAGVYCTLCGTVILYETRVGGVQYQLGTSGFLYRSNKLMYDRATQSLWSTLEGEPVIGPLVGQGIRLRRRSVVTTTWGEWRRRHPETTVLSLDTGFTRDYSEGAAYRDYFATDELMFNVPKQDKRLENKAEVFTVLLEGHLDQPLAIAASFLKRNPVHHERIGATPFVVLTDRSGANRAYFTSLADGEAESEIRFERWDQDRTAWDEAGNEWTLTESALEGPEGRRLPRVPAQRAFWFGWHAAFPDTRLVK